MRSGYFLASLLLALLFAGEACARGTLDSILPDIRAHHAGRLSDAEPWTDSDGHTHYRIKWLTPEGRIIYFNADAETGRFSSGGDDGQSYDGGRRWNGRDDEQGQTGGDGGERRSHWNGDGGGDRHDNGGDDGNRGGRWNGGGGDWHDRHGGDNGDRGGHGGWHGGHDGGGRHSRGNGN